MSLDLSNGFILNITCSLWFCLCYLSKTCDLNELKMCKFKKQVLDIDDNIQRLVYHSKGYRMPMAASNNKSWHFFNLHNNISVDVAQAVQYPKTGVWTHHNKWFPFLPNFFTELVPPVFETELGDITVNTPAGQPTAPASWDDPEVTDNSGNYSLTYSQDPGTLFGIGITEVIVTATDPSGNKAVIRFSVTVTGIALNSLALSLIL